MTECQGVRNRLHQGALIKKRDGDNNPALLTGKRQRIIGDHEEQLKQEPPQTRRMLDGMGCVGFVGDLAHSRQFLAVPSLSTTALPNPALVVPGSVTSPPKSIRREESSNDSSAISDGSRASTCDSNFTSMINNNEGVEIDSPASSSFKRGSLQSETSEEDWVCRAGGEEVMESDIGHRMWFLKMRGFDKFTMDMMDECIYDEPSGEDLLEGYCANVVNAAAQESKASLDQSHGACDSPLPQPIVVTPERLPL